MLRLLKRFLWVVLLAAGAITAPAYSNNGPIGNGPDAYQVPALSYGLVGDLGAPKGFFEEYRWNTPTIYYAFDQGFLEYFGSNGVAAVDAAFAMLNTNLNSSLSALNADLSEFPLETDRVNYRAQALNIYDLKSLVLVLMMEQLGLAEPERWTWALREKRTFNGVDIYTVLQRNFDPITSLPSSYVNGNLLTYRIIDPIDDLVNPVRADAVEFLVDPFSSLSSAVASGRISPGLFFTGLTRDDMAGFRYQWRTNNVNWESVPAGVEVVYTNTATPQFLVTSNLADLVNASLTNDAATLQGLFPGLVVLASSNYFTLAVTTNLTSFYTNYPWSPVGSPASLVSYTYYTTNLVVHYRHTFANVVTTYSYTNGVLKLQTTTVGFSGCSPYAPVGLPCTNVTLTTLARNLIGGEYYIVPTNFCGISITTTSPPTVVAITNVVLVATNAPTTTNVLGQQYSQMTITYATNHTFGFYPVICQASNAPTLLQGMDRMSFVRRDYDSLLGRFFVPATHYYRLVEIVNSRPVVRNLRRTVTQPDFVFTVTDLGTVAGWLVVRTPPLFNFANALPGLAGPGTIEPSTGTITFNKLAPWLSNYTPSFLDELTAFGSFVYGSFDGTTNAPIAYPNATSLESLEQQLLIQILPPTLPDASVGANYANVFSGFTATGGQPPYTWSLAPGSPGLPPALSLSASGRISGLPTTAGTFDFVVRMTDAGMRSLERSYSIKINP